uniref:RanBD1 domain-containing protein n=1 Tax=Cucumis melo TaxID=3656 RepID=A0A9I9DLV4_CUCME
MASSDTERREEEEAPAAEDEDTGAQVAPIVKLEAVNVTTGEEDEDAILDLKSKLYRFDKDGNQWKERGAGTVKFLKHKETGRVRLVMRQSKTLKICANHLVLPSMTVQEHVGNEKSCVWHATDFADGELKDELFCIRFPSIDNCKTLTEKNVPRSHLVPKVDSLLTGLINFPHLDCKTFMETFQEVAESQKKKVENKDASAAAGLLEKLSVEDEKKAEDKSEDKAEDTPVKSKEEDKPEGEAGKSDAEKKD